MTGWLLPLDKPKLEAALRDARGGNHESRWLAAMALGSENGPGRGDAIAALLHLAKDPLEEIRAQALEGLLEQSRCGDFGAPEKVIDQALADEAASVRCVGIEMAVTLLGSVLGRVLPLADDPAPTVRAAVAAALGESEPASHEDVLTTLLEDPSVFVRREAAHTLARLGDPGGEAVLIEALEEGGDFADRAAWALGLLGSEKAVPVLERRANSFFGGPEHKAICAVALAGCGSELGRTIVEKLLDGRSRRGRIAALGALAVFPIPGCVPRVARIIEAKAEAEQSVAVNALLCLAGVDREAALEKLETFRRVLSGDIADEIEEALHAIRLTAPC